MHFILGPEAAIDEIPVILKGQTLASQSSTLGTSNDAVRPKAIVLGGGFVGVFENVKSEVEKQFAQSGGSRVAWCMHDASKPHPPPGPEYGKVVMERCKELLGRLQSEGKLDDGRTETYYY